MAIDSEHRKLMLLVAILGMAMLAGCSMPQPPSLCWACEEGIEGAISNGSNSQVGPTALEIELESDGDAKWHVRAALEAETASRLAGNEPAVDRLGERAVYGDERRDRRSPIGEDRIENVSTAVRNGTLHLRFRVDDFADRRRGGILFVDTFQSRGEADRFQVGADRLVLRGPNGSVLLNDPPGVEAASDERTLVWTEPESISKDMYVVYGDDRGLTDRALAHGYIAGDAVGWIGPRLLVAVPFVGIWAGLMLLTHRVVYRSREGGGVPVRRVLLSFRFLLTVASLGVLTGYVVATGLRLPLWAGWIPVLPLPFFVAHAIAMTVDSRWRFELLACIAAVPMVALATVAGEPGLRWFWIKALVYLTVITMSGLVFGGGVWAFTYLCYRDTNWDLPR